MPSKHTAANLLRDLRFVLQGVLITFLLGALLGLIWGRFHIRNLHDTLEKDFQTAVERSALESRVRLDNHIKLLHHSGELLISQKNFHAYLAKHQPATDGGVLHHRRPPPWFPDRSIQRVFLKANYAFLMDDRGTIRETYSRRKNAIPVDLTQEITQTRNIATEDESWITRIDSGLYLLTNQHIPRQSGNRWERVLLVSAIDDSFLLSSQGVTEGENLLAIVDSANQRIIVSSNGEKVPPGTDAQTLRDHYKTGSEAFFDYGNSNVILQLLLLAPTADFKRLYEQVTHEATLEIIWVSLLYAGGFTIVLLWLSHNLNRFTVKIIRFSHSQLGMAPPPVEKGGPLSRMRIQFERMARLIQNARIKERRNNQELIQVNQELQRTIIMVRKTQEQLVQSEKMAALGGLVAGIAHEINTPLGTGYTATTLLETATRNLLRRFQEQKMTRSDLQNYLETAGESTRLAAANMRRAADLIRSFKRLAVDQASEVRRLFNVKDYLEEIFHSLQPRLKRTPIQVIINCPEELETDSYPGAFAQIFANLIINSLEHGLIDRERGEIRVDVERSGENLLFHYQDDGRGMEPEVVQKIFDPFFTTARGRGGSGLGMHIVYNLVHQTMGGEIRADSEIDVGTRFHLTLPTTAPVRETKTPADPNRQ